jgi:hypothetical protein
MSKTDVVKRKIYIFMKLVLCRKHIDVILNPDLSPMYREPGAPGKNLNSKSARDSSLHFIPFRMTIFKPFLQSRNWEIASVPSLLFPQ